MLYDEEFLEAQGNDWDTMLTNFKNDKKTFSKEKRLISSYSVDIDSTVDYATVKGRECATLNSSTFETVKSKSTRTYAKFMCRKDNNGKWKILGWEKTDASESEE